MCCPVASITRATVESLMTSNLPTSSNVADTVEYDGPKNTQSHTVLNSIGASTLPKPTRRASKRSAPVISQTQEVENLVGGNETPELGRIESESETQVAHHSCDPTAERMPSFDLHPLSTDFDNSAIQGLSASSLFRRRLSRRKLQHTKIPNSEASTSSECAFLTPVESSETRGHNCPAISVISTAQSTGDIPILASNSFSDTNRKLTPASFADLHSAAMGTGDHTRLSSVSSPGNFKKLLRDRYLSSQGRSERDHFTACSESTGNILSDEQKMRADQLLSAIEAFRYLVSYRQQLKAPVEITNLVTGGLTDSPGRFVPQTIPYRREHSVPWNAELAQSLPKYQALRASQLGEHQLQLPDLVNSAFLRCPSSWPSISNALDDTERPESDRKESSQLADSRIGVSSSSEDVYLDKSHVAVCPFARALSNLAFDLSKPLSSSAFALSLPSDLESAQSQSAPISPHRVSDGSTMPLSNLADSRLGSTAFSPLQGHTRPVCQRSLSSQETTMRSTNPSSDKGFVYSAPVSVTKAPVSTLSQPSTTSTDSVACCRWGSPKPSPNPQLQTNTFLTVPSNQIRAKPPGAFVFPPPSPIPPLISGKAKQQTDTPLSSLSWISSLSTGSLTDSTGSPCKLEDVKDQSAALVELMSNLARVHSLQSPICLSKSYSPNSYTIQSSADGQTCLSSPTCNDLQQSVTSYPRPNEKRRRAAGSRGLVSSNLKSVIVSMTADPSGNNKNSTRGGSTRTRGSTTSGGSHVCPICSRQFNRSDMLVRHLHVHTGSRPFECRECGQAFSRSDHLSTHQRTHTGHRPYRCSLCSYSACRRDMITRHLRVHQRRGQRERAETVFNSQPVTSQHSNPSKPQELILFNTAESQRGKKLGTSRSAQAILCDDSTTIVTAASLPSS